MPATRIWKRHVHTSTPGSSTSRPSMANQRASSITCLIKSLQRCSVRAPAAQHRRCINTAVPQVEADALPDVMLTTPLHSSSHSAQSTPSALHGLSSSSIVAPSHSPRYAVSRTPIPPQTSTPSPTSTSLSEPGPSSSILPTTPTEIPQSVRENLTYLTAQPPYYTTIHIHGKPYLVTAGDTIRLPFLMEGVTPGDVLRLNRASLLGSRDWTLKAGSASASALGMTTTITRAGSDLVTGKTDGLDSIMSATPPQSEKSANKRKKAPTYLDERLFTCRAVVMGSESEPMRIMRKTKRRQRHTRHVKSKHKYTILKIREVSVNEV
jgi:large subunit ribosomal protein L21